MENHSPTPTPNESAPPLNLIFVDFENVHQVDVAIIGAKSVHFTLLLGANQTKLEAGLVEKLLEHAASVQLIRLASSGKNALDFALAYYVGRAVSAHPGAFVHIISHDTGFDPLIEHLRNRHIHARRHDDFTSLPFIGTGKAPAAQPAAHLPPPAPAVSGNVKAPLAMPTVKPAVVDGAMLRALEHLRMNPTNRPKKKPTLLRHLKSMLGKDASEEDAAELFEQLEKAGHLKIGDKDAVLYHVAFPATLRL